MSEDRSEIDRIRIVFTVEYEVTEGEFEPPDGEEQEMWFVQALLAEAPDRGFTIQWGDQEETRFEPCGWGVQTDYWGDLWSGIEPPKEVSVSGSSNAEPGA